MENQKALLFKSAFTGRKLDTLIDGHRIGFTAAIGIGNQLRVCIHESMQYNLSIHDGSAPVLPGKIINVLIGIKVIYILYDKSRSRPKCQVASLIGLILFEKIKRLRRIARVNGKCARDGSRRHFAVDCKRIRSCDFVVAGSDDWRGGSG